MDEGAEADAVLHGGAASRPATLAQRADVMTVLDGMAQDGMLDPAWPARTIEVLNKADLLGGVAGVPARNGGVAVSAITGEGIATLRGLPRTADRSVLLCTDLHAGNVLASQREPWLVIDPKPFIGDPAYEPVQHMLNCDERLATDPASLAQRMADPVVRQ